MGQIGRFGVILACICLGATLVLAVTYEITKPAIEAAMKHEEAAALKEIMPDADNFIHGTRDGMDYFEAKKGKDTVGYCLSINAQGYGGNIRMIAGIKNDGTIQGIKVLEHYETPGLGSKINEIRPGENEPWFTRQFKGKKAEGLEIRNNINAITGATISSRAVTDAVRKVVTNFLQVIQNSKVPGPHGATAGAGKSQN